MVIGLFFGYQVNDFILKKEIYTNISKPVSNVIEEDHNRDGHTDTIIYFQDASDNYPWKTDVDADFDGRFETTVLYDKKLISKAIIDIDGDDKVDVEEMFEYGSLKRIVFYDASERMVKVSEYEGGMLKRSKHNTDGDSKFDTYRTYDKFEEIIKTEKK